jgi:acyl-CoA reductase-like NAD-dependent aldehyde dehydrogenase
MFEPLRQARGELESGLANLGRIADTAKSALHDTSVAATGKPFSYTMRRVAKGVIYTIAPWNYPFFTALNSIGPARPALLPQSDRSMDGFQPAP